MFRCLATVWLKSNYFYIKFDFLHNILCLVWLLFSSHLGLHSIQVRNNYRRVEVQSSLTWNNSNSIHRFRIILKNRSLMNPSLGITSVWKVVRKLRQPTFPITIAKKSFLSDLFPMDNILSLSALINSFVSTFTTAASKSCWKEKSILTKSSEFLFSRKKKRKRKRKKKRKKNVAGMK